MTAGMNCQQFEEHVVELALGGVGEPRRAELAAHAASCPACHVRLEELSWLGERLLLLAPEIEPPPGFESRVLDRLGAAAEAPSAMAVGAAGAGNRSARAGTVRTATGSSEGSARRPARRRALATGLVAALAGALAALGVVAVIDRANNDGDGGERAAATPALALDELPADRQAAILRADGTVAGTAVVAAGPRPHLLVTIDSPRPRATPVLCELVRSDGQAVVVGSWSFADVEHGAWAVGIDAVLLDAERMDVKDDSGAVLASARFPR